MSLLSTLQARLGGFEAWSSKILRLLFIDAPTDRNIQTVAAFFYDNGASCAMCSQTYHAFNDGTTAYVTQYIYEMYEIWQRSMFEHRIARYYNLHVKRYVFLNGHRLNQLEYACAPSDNPFGIAGTGFTTIIQAKLQCVRDAGVFYYP
jgi:hypothetical protein